LKEGRTLESTPYIQQHNFTSLVYKCVQKYAVQNWNGMVFWWRQSVNFGCPFMHFYRKTLHVFKVWFKFIWMHVNKLY